MHKELSYLYGKPAGNSGFKVQPEDFFVCENLNFTPDGTGEHLLIRVRKRGMNTPYVARLLADHVGVAQKQVGWAGLKDRHAVTEQWFAIHLPGKGMPDLSELENDDLQILEMIRHSKKMRIGALSGNWFRLRLTELTQPDETLRRLEMIAGGVPNYFGEQRFGRDASNLKRAEELFSGRKIRDRTQRSMALSAARSYLFNRVASERIGQNLGTTLLAGDCVMLKGSRSFFAEEELTSELLQRFVEGDLLLSAPLWGAGELPSLGAARELELAALSDYQGYCLGLEKAEMRQERRPLMLVPDQFTWRVDGDDLELEFYLPSGSFATSVVRELVQTPENPHQ